MKSIWLTRSLTSCNQNKPFSISISLHNTLVQHVSMCDDSNDGDASLYFFIVSIDNTTIQFSSLMSSCLSASSLSPKYFYVLISYFSSKYVFFLSNAIALLKYLLKLLINIIYENILVFKVFACIL